MEHHAYLLIGSPEWAAEMIPESDLKASADLSRLVYERMGIDDARSLIEDASRKPVSHTHRVFVLVCQNFTREAQNALLKLFEEPPLTARFYLIVPTDESLIPTLRSRLYELTREGGGLSDEKNSDIFLKATYAERLALVERLVKRDDTRWLRPFLDTLERNIQKEGRAEELSELVFLRTHIGKQGASKKMLLDHLALSLLPRS